VNTLESTSFNGFWPNLVHIYLVLRWVWNPIDFQGQRSKSNVKFLGEGIRHALRCPCSIFSHGYQIINISHHICGAMVSVLASSAVDRGFEPRSGQTKDYIIGICCLSAKHAALRRKSNHWLARNQTNVSEWSDMSTRGLLFQWASTIKIKLNVLV
jgi:hypothetical protein